MKLKKLVQILIVGCGILALGACSSAHKRNGMDDANYSSSDGSIPGGAHAAGYGSDSNFGGPTARNGRTYYFDYDKSEVRDQDKPAIFANANYLVSHSNARVIVEGHTDPRGSREYNVALGERRANAVAELLKSKGVNPSQIRVVSYGAERLASPGHTEADYQMDRRAVIVYSRR